MSKKDYELIARVLREAMTAYQGAEWTNEAKTVNTLAQLLAARLAEDNSRFNRSK